MINTYNIDCLKLMETRPDEYYDICIADPPYGHPNGMTRNGGSWTAKYGNVNSWDLKPSDRMFDEMFRCSREQIIWGGNYFRLPPCTCFLIWDKKNISESFTMSMCEYAWTSLDGNAKLFKCTPQGTAKEKRFHPTQKPTALYEWIFRMFAKPGMKILDPFGGSFSSAVAIEAMGLDVEFDICEINEDYYKQGVGRLEHARLTRPVELPFKEK